MLQKNDTRVLLKRKLEFSIASLANSTLAILASLVKSTNKKQSNNAEPRLVPLCWQCGKESDLLKVHTAQAAFFVCRDCSGEK